MGSIFGGKPKKVTPPPVPDPAPIPEVSEEVSDEAMRKAVRRSGRRKTIITGNLVPMSTGKKTTYG